MRASFTSRVSEDIPKSRFSLPFPEARNRFSPERCPVAEMSELPDFTESRSRSILLLVNLPLKPVILLSRG